MRIFKNLLTPEECQKLNEVAFNYLQNGVLTENAYPGRFTTRYIGDEFTFEPVVYALSTKIRIITDINKYPLERGRGKDGVNVAVTLSDGYIALHTDPKGPDGEVTYRCNVITQKSEVGGELIIDNKVVPLEVGDVHCYAVSEEPHLVTAVEGSTPRILWMFGAHIPIESWDFENMKVKQ